MFVFRVLRLRNSWHSAYQSFLRCVMCKHFLLVSGLPLCFSDPVFGEQNGLNCIKHSLPLFLSGTGLLLPHLRNLHLPQDAWFSPIFSRRHHVFTFYTWIYDGVLVDFPQAAKYPKFMFRMRMPNCTRTPGTVCEKTALSPLNRLGASVKNQSLRRWFPG